jgi:outer membrane PBP1 activator LpoA protein
MRSAHPPETASVILFRPRQAGLRTPDKGPRPQGAAGSRRPLLVSEDNDDHRRRIHALGLAFCLVLSVVGVWLANEFTEMKRVQDCVLSGRTGCIPLKVAAHSDRALP